MSSPPKSSLRDGVTGLYNEKQLLIRLAENMAKCGRTKEKMFVILWDVDGFVRFNSDFGQTVGDELLRKVAGTIRQSLRVYDEAFRVGPDEFCAILLPADQKIAKEVTDRVSSIVAKKLFEPDAEYANHQFSLTSAFVTYPDDSNGADALLHAARQALYHARKSRQIV